MQIFPIIFPIQLDLADLIFLFGIGSIILLVTAQLSPSFYVPTDFTVDKKRLENAGIIAGVFFLASVAIRIINLIGV